VKEFLHVVAMFVSVIDPNTRKLTFQEPLNVMSNLLACAPVYVSACARGGFETQAPSLENKFAHSSLQAPTDCRAVFLLVYKAGEDLRLLELDNEVIEVMEISPEEDSKNKGRHRHMNEDIFKEKFAKWERQQLKEVQRIQAVPSTFPATDTKKKDAVTRRGSKRDRKLEEGTDGKIETSVSTWLDSNLSLVLDKTLAPLLTSQACQD
jgi:hypothetical protein